MLILVLSLIFLTGCLMKEGPENVHTIRYELGHTWESFTDPPSTATAGKTVEIRTYIMCDADIHVYVDGEEIEKTHYDGNGWGYTFVMPDKDVTVTAKYYTKEEIWGVISDDDAGKTGDAGIRKDFS